MKGDPMATKKPKRLTLEELQKTCRVIATYDGEGDLLTKAVLVLINEFRNHRDDRVYIEDTADSLVIELFRETRAFEQSAYAFAKSVTVPQL